MNVREKACPGSTHVDLRMPRRPMLAIRRRDRGDAAASRAVAFTTDVRPLLTKLGCNSGGCHGKATGQNGFKLSLLGYEPAEDYEALVREARGRRLFPPRPRRASCCSRPPGPSPTAAAGCWRRIRRITRSSAAGSNRVHHLPGPTTRSCSASTIEPVDAVLSRNHRVSLRVRASLSDGSTRDVTRLALYESNEPDVAEVSASGEIRTKRPRRPLRRDGALRRSVRRVPRDRAVSRAEIGRADGRSGSGPVVGRSVVATSSGDAWGSSRRRRPTTRPSSAAPAWTSAARSRRPRKSAATSPTAAPTSVPA